MSPMFLLSIVCLLFQQCIGQNVYYYKLDTNDVCKGNTYVHQLGLNIIWDINEIYNENGTTKSDSNLGPTKQWRATVCGPISDANAVCEGVRTWCLEETYLNDTCIYGIVNWDEESTITYSAIVDSQDKYLGNVLGIRVTINDSDEDIDTSCPNKEIVVNYDIICEDTPNTLRSISESEDGCEFNVSWAGVVGCSDYRPIVSSDRYLISSGEESCIGSVDIPPPIDKTIEWDLLGFQNDEGFEKGDDELNPSLLYRLSACGAMNFANTACTGERDLCLETVSVIDKECVQPLAAWDGLSEVSVYALFEGASDYVGMCILLYDEQLTNASECGSQNRPTRVNYDLYCNPNQEISIVTYISVNEELCQYNISMQGKSACATVKNPSKDNFVDDLSAGWILFIIFVVLMFVYMTLGCVYNGCVNGRVGMDAMPNKASWEKLFRYTKAGCDTTKDTCCFCGRTTTNYQEL